MSWTPTFWISKDDYEKCADEINDTYCYKFDFTIAGAIGKVLSCDTTTKSRELHEVIKNTEHYLLTGECPVCKNCKTWEG